MQAIKDLIPRALNGRTPPPASEQPQPQRMPERALLSDLDTDWHPLVQSAVDAARLWQKRKRTDKSASLVLVSSPIPGDLDRTGYGCGKTHIARAILWSTSFCRDGVSIAPANVFYQAAELIGRLHDGEPVNLLIRPHDENRRGRFLGVDAAIIDDVGTEKRLDYVNSKAQDLERQKLYYQAINHCYTKGIGVVVTANMGLQELAEHIGGRAWSRLQQMAPRGQMVDLTGVPDYRRAKSGRSNGRGSKP